MERFSFAIFIILLITISLGSAQIKFDEILSDYNPDEVGPGIIVAFKENPKISMDGKSTKFNSFNSKLSKYKATLKKERSPKSIFFYTVKLDNQKKINYLF